MALAMSAAPAMQDDIMDIDIDMDVDDIPATADEDVPLEEGEQPADDVGNGETAGLIPAIYLEDPAQEPEWNKIHLKGVDDLSTDHVKTLATDSYPDAEPHVQWVDDTSANLVYKDKSAARAAFIEISQTPTSIEDVIADPFKMRQAKPLVSHPASLLTLRVAQVGDRKRKNAKDASRYYLLHPEADPRERMRNEFAAGRPSRSENGDYRRRRFDDREHRRRQDQDYNSNDPTNDFEASMYDDVPSAAPKSQTRGRDLFSRIGDRPRRRSASPTANGDAISLSGSEDDRDTRKRRGGYRDRQSPARRNNTGKELFGGASDSNNGMRSDNIDQLSRKKPALTRENSDELRQQTNMAAARRFKADIAATSAQSPARNHRRSRAIDSRVEEDLAERFGRKSISLDSTKSVTQQTHNAGKELFSDDSRILNGGGGLSVRGSAAQGMSIKGRADVKELFPDRFGSAKHSNPNAGKELIDRMDAPVGRSRGPRKRAGDLFD